VTKLDTDPLPVEIQWKTIFSAILQRDVWRILSIAMNLMIPNGKLDFLGIVILIGQGGFAIFNPLSAFAGVLFRMDSFHIFIEQEPIPHLGMVDLPITRVGVFVTSLAILVICSAEGCRLTLFIFNLVIIPSLASLEALPLEDRLHSVKSGHGVFGKSRYEKLPVACTDLYTS
jgi:hypothetical protein